MTDTALISLEESDLFTTEEKEAITKNLERDLDSFLVHMEAADAQRHKKPWIQSTELSDKIGIRSRICEAVISSINTTITNFLRSRSSKLRQAGTILPDIQEKICTDIINPDIICPVDDKYRTANGSCNNRVNPNFGAAGIAMLRFALPPSYADGMYLINNFGFIINK